MIGPSLPGVVPTGGGGTIAGGVTVGGTVPGPVAPGVIGAAGRRDDGRARRDRRSVALRRCSGLAFGVAGERRVARDDRGDDEQRRQRDDGERGAPARARHSEAAGSGGAALQTPVLAGLHRRTTSLTGVVRDDDGRAVVRRRGGELGGRVAIFEQQRHGQEGNAGGAVELRSSEV